MDAAEIIAGPPREALTRWTPRRLLLVNVHNYTAQELLFSRNGWLLLRGANGSGKSTALEASLPFVLDADLQRFAAASGASRSWRTALLPTPEIRHRTAHVAIEWEGPTGWLTTGATLDAQVGKAEVDHLHWMTTQRVGVSAARTYLDLDGAHTDAMLLVNGEDQPLRIKDVKDLRDDERMLAQSSKRDEWQQHVNRRMFGFADEEDLRRYLRTLHTVRNISRAVEDNNPDSFSRRLLDGLPELDASTLADVRDALEGVRRYADDLASATAAADRLTEILSVYGDYVARVVRGRVDRLVDAREVAGRAETDQARLADQLAQAQGKMGRIVSAQEHTESEARGARAAHDELKHSDEAEPAKRLTRARTQASQSENAGAEAERRASEDAGEAERAVAERDRILTQLAAAREGRRATGAAAALHLREAGGPPIEPLGAITAAVTARRLAVDRQRQLGKDEASARQERDVAETAAETARAERDTRQIARDRAESDCAVQREDLVAGLAAWAARPPLNLSAERARGLADDCVSGGPDQLEVKLRGQVGLIERELGRLGRQRDEMAKAVEQVEHQLELAHAAPEPPVELPTWLGEDDREPLWRVAEFADHLDEAMQDELEAALEASGLLFSTIGAARMATATATKQLAPASRSAQTLADALQIGGSQAADWHVILSQIPLGPGTDGRLAIERSSWSAGPLTVTAASRPARLIGHTARERARRQRIASLKRELAELAVEQVALAARLSEASERRASFEQQRSARPGDARFRAAVTAAASAEAVLVEVAARVLTAEHAAKLAGEALSRAVAARTAHAADHALGGDLTLVLQQLDAADEQVSAARHHDDRLNGPDGLEGRHAAAAETAARLVSRAEIRQREAVTAIAAARAAVRVAEELQASLGEAAAAFDARLTQLERVARAADEAVKRLTGEHVEIAKQTAGLEIGLEAATRDLERHRIASSLALADFHGLDDAGVLAVVAGRVNGVALAVSPNRDAGVLDGVELDALLVDISAGSTRFPAADPTRSRQRVEELVRSAQADTGVTHTAVLGDVLWVFRPDAEGDTSLRRLHDRTVADRKRYEDLFNQGQRRLVEEHLMRHLAGHLQRRLGEARDLIDMQNHVLRGKQTTSGVAVKLKLDLREDLEPELRELHDLLDPRRGSVDAMEPAERRQIMDAFTHAIGLVSSEHWQEAGGLERLLDYRGWLRVDLYEVGVLARRKGMGELRITKQVSGIGSGGERAWMIYMPLLAALSGQADRTEHGPKIVPMDEALAKVDLNGAEEFFNALSDFGMSCILTSEKLSPTSPTQGSLSSYQCETVADSVFVMHTYWDADRRQRLEDRAEQLAADLLR